MAEFTTSIRSDYRTQEQLFSQLAVRCLLLVTSPLLTVMLAHDGIAQSTHNWPQWRGPLATGVAPNANPPLKWSEQENVRWKQPLPGLGHSTPIVWNDRVFVTTAIPFGKSLEPRYSRAPGAHDNLPVTSHFKFVVLALSRDDGETIWQRTLDEGLPHEAGHHTGSLASNSPVTDGKLLFAFFGSNGLYCFNFEGDEQWAKDLGKMRSKHGHGEGSSPVLYQDTLIVNWDHEGQSFVEAYEKRTGKRRWKQARDEPTSWASPIVVVHNGKPQVVVSGTNRIRGYDLATGDSIWECGGLSANVVASPVAGGGMVFSGSSYNTRALLAIRLEGAKGDITSSEQVAWKRTRGTPYVPSPLLYGNALYFLAHYQGILSRIDTRTGADRPGPFRLHGVHNVYASPVGGASRVYITDLDGTTIVISHDDTPQLLATNTLNDSFSASAALVGDEIFLRGRNFLYCIAEE